MISYWKWSRVVIRPVVEAPSADAGPDVHLDDFRLTDGV
ncbi:hypothetical protein CHELA40_12760 [Chelatococcus asaccharovorans]|nr:hypothetical protein CHELA40_12760 [Chelatococcus asaccharovorans]